MISALLCLRGRQSRKPFTAMFNFFLCFVAIIKVQIPCADNTDDFKKETKTAAVKVVGGKIFRES